MLAASILEHITSPSLCAAEAKLARRASRLAHWYRRRCVWCVARDSCRRRGACRIVRWTGNSCGDSLRVLKPAAGPVNYFRKAIKIFLLLLRNDTEINASYILTGHKTIIFLVQQLGCPTR
jgi:hypothetical protein